MCVCVNGCKYWRCGHRENPMQIYMKFFQPTSLRAEARYAAVCACYGHNNNNNNNIHNFV